MHRAGTDDDCALPLFSSTHGAGRHASAPPTIRRCASPRALVTSPARWEQFAPVPWLWRPLILIDGHGRYGRRGPLAPASRRRWEPRIRPRRPGRIRAEHIRRARRDAAAREYAWPCERPAPPSEQPAPALLTSPASTTATTTTTSAPYTAANAPVFVVRAAALRDVLRVVGLRKPGVVRAAGHAPAAIPACRSA